MSKRIKLTTPILNSRFEAEACAREIAELKTEYAMAEAEMNEAVTAAKMKFEDKFAPIEKRILEKSSLLQGWAEANPSEFAGKKSLDMTHALIGWRTGQPALKTLSGWTWDRVLEKLHSTEFWRTYIRTKEEPDKEGLIAARHNLGAEDYREVGLKVVQAESFFIEPKLEQAETRINAETERRAA